MENLHNEEIRDFKEKLHKQGSEMKEFVMDDEFSKSEIIKEIKVFILTLILIEMQDKVRVST